MEPPLPGSNLTRGSSLLHFARHGGPDLSDLRGFGDMPRAPGRPTRATLGRVHKPRGNKSGSRGGGSRSGSRSTQKKSASPYDAAFKQHLIDYCVWPIDHYLKNGKRPPAPDNLQNLAGELNGEPGSSGRESLEPDAFTADDFEQLQKAYNIAAAEEARSRTLDAVEGSLALSSSHVKRGPFKSARLAALTPDNLVPGNPDRAYGSRPEKLLPSVRRALAHLILPTAAQDLLCPNFVVHVKGPNGDPEVAKLQAVYDGALAARGMEALWTHASAGGSSTCNNTMDGTSTARTITCTLADGVLRMYAVHLYQPAGVGSVAYSTSRLGSWLLYDDLQQFRRGAAAFRNGLEWARRQREEAITAANAAGSGDGQDNYDNRGNGGGNGGTGGNNDNTSTNDESREEVLAPAIASTA